MNAPRWRRKAVVMTEELDQETEAALGEGGLKALQAERTARREAEREAKTLRDKIAEFERRDTVAAVAAKHGIPAHLANRLQGNTEAEIEADAKTFAEALKPAEPEKQGGNGRPKEALTSGAIPQGEPVDDTAALVDKILS
jgi:hypothetical protein